MDKAKVAINGLGRIGRMVLRQMVEDEAVELVAVNASYPPETLAHMIKHDSVHGRFPGEVTFSENALYINEKMITLCQERDPEQLPWGDMGIDIVIEATGKFREREEAAKHMKAGAKKVIITAPGKQPDATIVMGVNNEAYDHRKHDVISNASCTTNCLAPVVKILEDNFKIVDGLMTTVHSFTNDQQNLDNPHKDLRRARGCTQSIIPTSTGAAKTIAEVIPSLDGKLNGMALRVPTPNVSLIDLVVDLKTDVTEEMINEAFYRASQGELKNILSYSEEPLVSIDYTSSPYSSIIDGLTTQVIGERKVKVLAWYDNEWGYSARTIDLTKMVAEQLMSERRQKVS